MLQQSFSRIRFMIAALALLGAMWAAIDIHQHEKGFHQATQCVTCSLEKTVSHGFTLHAAIQPAIPGYAFTPVLWKDENATAVRIRLVSIRAPPCV